VCVDATSIRRKILVAFEAAEIESDPKKIRALLTFVLVGAGPTGVEMAGGCSRRRWWIIQSVSANPL
jgi:NADH dehydrogenase